MRALVAACTAGLVTASAVYAQPAASLARAKQLYDDATAAMTAERYEEAAADFAAAFDITQDPVLFFKIASANEKAGHCETAIEYYRRYLAEAKPEPSFVTLTDERIAACSAMGSDTGSATTGSGSATETGSGSAMAAAPAAAPETGSGSGTGTGSIRSEDTPWLLVGGALAFVTLGAVLAYSASSSESDISDLYQGVDNQPVVFDATTAQRYHDLVAEGHRYEYLSWASFGIGAAFGAAAAIYFVHDYNEKQYLVVPTATPHGAGVSAIVHF
jgi:tetratricopeptide (TPR) repeat protein